MGCPSAGVGYELDANLDFDTDNSGSVGAGDDYPNWTPVGNSVTGYSAQFNGNGHTITDLTTSGSINAGLFGYLSPSGVVRDLGIITPNVSGINLAGGLAGTTLADSEIAASYVRNGTVTLSSITGTTGIVGGLVGRNRGTIRASYATASVNAGNFANAYGGGLVGRISGKTIASYAAGAVSGGAGSNSYIGGFAGFIIGSNSAITDSYCDTSVLSPTTTPCIGGRSGLVNVAATTVPDKTAAELQGPTGYTGIYANWRVDAAGDTFPDQPWNFPAGQYPTLKTPTERQADPATGYDADGDNLINVASQAHLDAIRYDLNGDGLPEAVGDYVAYAAAFPAGDLASTGTRMGCASGCIGYELDADLALAGDWTPIDGAAAGYAAEFNGNGRTITGLTVLATFRAGLFGRLESGGAIRDLGIMAPNVSGSTYAGGLVGLNKPGAEITASYVQGRCHNHHHS